MGQFQADINDLIRTAYDAQIAFDNWDGGYTIDLFSDKPREVTLDQVVDELDDAVLAIVTYVEKNGASIRADIEEGSS